MVHVCKLTKCVATTAVAVGLVVLLAAIGLGCRREVVESPPTVEHSKTLVSKPTSVMRGVYLLGKNSPGAAYAVDTSDGLVLIDTGLEKSAAIVKRQLIELGLDVARLKAILLTHVHADHSLGAGHLRELTGARTYAGKGDCEPLRTGGPREAFFSVFYMPDVFLHSTTIDVELIGNEKITIGDTTFEAIATPGHTPGSVCFQLERDGKRVLFTGDVVQAIGQSTKETLGIYSAFLAPVYRGDARDFLATLKRLRALPPPDLVLPGHPNMDSPPQNPHIPAARWHDMLDAGIKAMEQLLARRAADGANFLDGTPKEVLKGLHYLGDINRRAVYCIEAPKGLVLVDAPGGPALGPFLESRFKEKKLAGRKVVAVLLTSVEDGAVSGLAELVKREGSTVVAHESAISVVRELCPPKTEIVPAAEASKWTGIDLKSMALRGRGKWPIAYRFRWANKDVLISGRIPEKLDAESVRELVADVGGPSGTMVHFLQSLEQLTKPAPDVWLPAMPIQGQNAFLYDREWETVIERNSTLFLR